MTMMDGPSWEELGVVKRGLWCDFCFLPSAVKIRVKDEGTDLTLGYTYVCVNARETLWPSMTDLEAFEVDPVGTIINSMSDDEFMEMLRVALSKGLTPDDLSLCDGFPCFWDTVG